VKMHFPVALVSLTRLTWHSNAFLIEAPLIPFKMNVRICYLCDGNLWELGAFLQTDGKFRRQKV
jgi:hypothetical protein